MKRKTTIGQINARIHTHNEKKNNEKSRKIEKFNQSVADE